MADIVTSAVYPTTCAALTTCSQPTSTTDARGAVADYTYASHGGVLTVTEPAPTSGAVRRQTRYAYDSLYAWCHGAVVILGCFILCGAARIVAGIRTTAGVIG